MHRKSKHPKRIPSVCAKKGTTFPYIRIFGDGIFRPSINPREEFGSLGPCFFPLPAPSTGAPGRLQVVFDPHMRCLPGMRGSLEVQYGNMVPQQK